LLFVLVWRNRRSFVPEAFREELAESLRSLAALSRRLLLLIGSSCHALVIVALHREIELEGNLMAIR